VARNPRIRVLHGVNLHKLGKRDPQQYGTFTLADLEKSIKGFAKELDLRVSFLQTDSEEDYIHEIYDAADLYGADGLILNPGAWTHYSWAIHDALEIASLPTVEVHISDIKNREEWRKHSVISDLCVQTVSGKGQEGYRIALETLAKTFKDRSLDA